MGYTKRTRPLAAWAAAETARSGGGSGLRRTVQAAALSWALFGVSMTQAQVVAAPGAASAHRPGVSATANGTPLVQITAPSAAGVSRNVYRRFDVNQAGVILNNSHRDSKTQLGGWVQGNPSLAGRRARVILNEVNSTDPSLLRGPIEVAGQRADVIVANPAGIVVNGGRFINAARATLTTGRPVLTNGTLQGFEVRSGSVHIEGLGLDAATTDHATLLARAIEVNAGVWARHLSAVAGANDVSADAAHVMPIAPIAPDTPASEAPHMAIDVAALGGMYAEHTPSSSAMVLLAGWPTKRLSPARTTVSPTSWATPTLPSSRPSCCAAAATNPPSRWATAAARWCRNRASPSWPTGPMRRGTPTRIRTWACAGWVGRLR